VPHRKEIPLLVSQHTSSNRRYPIILDLSQIIKYNTFAFYSISTLLVFLYNDAGLLEAIDPRLDLVMEAVAKKFGHVWEFYNQSWRPALILSSLDEKNLAEAVDTLCGAADWLVELHQKLKAVASSEIVRRLLRVT